MLAGLFLVAVKNLFKSIDFLSILATIVKKKTPLPIRKRRLLKILVPFSAERDTRVAVFAL